MLESIALFFIILCSIMGIFLASRYNVWRQNIKEVIKVINSHDHVNINHLTAEQVRLDKKGVAVDDDFLPIWMEITYLQAGSRWAGPMSDVYSFALHGEYNTLFFLMRVAEGELLPKSVALNSTKVRLNQEIIDKLTEYSNEQFVIWKLSQGL